MNEYVCGREGRKERQSVAHNRGGVPLPPLEIVKLNNDIVDKVKNNVYSQ
jgi:hypothetical protein